MSRKTRLPARNLDQALHVAQLASMEAGDFALEHFTRVHVLREKPMSTDEVTWVDVECEKRIVKILRKNFPKDSILTEERKLPKTQKQDMWWIDPLDGSISYFFGLPYWGVSLALIRSGKPQAGVLYFPQTRDLYWAIKGEGAWRNYRKIKVSSTKKVLDGIVGIDYGYRTERESGVLEVTQRVIDRVKYAVTYACTIGAIALVAEGKLAGYIHHMARRFDLAAGSLLVAEAGGTLIDTAGKPVDWKDTKPFHFVITNGRIHSELLSILNAPHQ